MRAHYQYAVLAFLLGLGCGSGAPPATVDPASSGPTGDGSGRSGMEPGGSGLEATGLEGTAVRGPTRPVCQVDNPCTAPFSGTFEVRQGERVVTRFQSDSAGHFQVQLAPGAYRIVPDAAVGILIRRQAHEVTVLPTGITHVVLDFDTGIQ